MNPSQKISLSTITLAGIAIFSMFFGAGNVIFPLKVGLLAGDKIACAMSGLFLTAIGGPLLGLIVATLYKGNCLDFFCRPGRAIGFLFIAISLLLLGPFAVIPRCFVVAYSSISSILGTFNLFYFSLVFGLAALFCALKQNLILPILGKIFSPILLLCLLFIIAFGALSGPNFMEGSHTSIQAFKLGVQEGFDTMDLIAAIFFSSSIWSLLLLKMEKATEKTMMKTAIFSALIGGALLGLVYLGLGLAAARHAELLANCPPEKLMSTLAMMTLGPLFGNLANLAITLACFTTAVSLSQTIASLCSKEFFPKKLNYSRALFGILLISIAFSNLGFKALSAFIHPVISICYPAIIILTIFNLGYKLYGFQMIKRPVYGMLFLSTISQIIKI